MKKDKEVKRIGIDVPSDLWLNVRAKALQERKPLAQWVAEAFIYKLKDNNAKSL